MTKNSQTSKKKSNKNFSDKNLQTSVKKTQNVNLDEKSHKNVNLGDKKSQTSVKRMQESRFK